MFLSFNATQWVFTTVSLANLLCCFLLGSGPVGCLLCCLSNGETQIWLGDLRLALVSLVCVLLVFAIMICQASCDHRRPCRSFLTNSFDSCQDRAFERDRPHRRKKNQSDLSSLLKFTVVVMDDAFASFLLQCREMVEIRKTFRGGFE